MTNIAEYFYWTFQITPCQNSFLGGCSVSSVTTHWVCTVCSSDEWDSRAHKPSRPDQCHLGASHLPSQLHRHPHHHRRHQHHHHLRLTIQCHFGASQHQPIWTSHPCQLGMIFLITFHQPNTDQLSIIIVIILRLDHPHQMKNHHHRPHQSWLGSHN